jgi:hypothetical protein
MKKQTLWFLLGASAILGIAAVAPQGGGSSGVPVSNGSATNLSVYSSGTTNRPLRVFGTNGTSEVYVDKDANLYTSAGIVTKSGNYNDAAILFGTSSSASGWAAYNNGVIMVNAMFGYGPYFPVEGAGFADTMKIWWASGGDPAYGSRDTGLGRNAAGRIEANNGTAGTYRDLVTRSSFTTNLYATNITAQGYLTTQQTLAYASGTNVTVDASKSLHFVTLTNTSYFAQPSSLAVGSSFTVILKQDGTGGRAVTFDTNYWKFPGGVQPSITTNANAYSVLSCIADPYGTNVFSVSTLDIK